MAARDPHPPYAGIPELPPAVAEWEELLLRLELGPRAVRNLLEELPSDRWQVKGAEGWSLHDHVAHLAAREAALTERLPMLHESAELVPWDAERTSSLDGYNETDALRHLDHFSTYRARNFGFVQRRGLEVWYWAARHPEHGRVTAYQFLSGVVRHDTRHLARMRDLARQTAEP